MDQEIKEIFEKLFQILVDCNLVKVMDDAEQIKEQLWFRFYPLIQELVKSKTDLNQFLKKTMALLDIDENLKSGLNCLFERIVSELELLKFRFATQQNTIDNHEKKIDVLESEIKLQKARVIAFDVIRLFRFYYIDDILKGSPFSTWQPFTSKFIRILKLIFFLKRLLNIDEWAKREADVLKKLTANDATIVNNDPTIFDKVQQDPSILQVILIRLNVY